MSWFNLKQTMGTNYRADPGDIINMKKALNQVGYYDVPPHRGIDDWTDDAMFNGIRSFQKDNGLKVDGLMRPGGPTETAINASMENPANTGSSQSPPSIPGASTPQTSNDPYGQRPLWKWPGIWLNEKQREIDRQKEEERRRTNPTPPAGGIRG